MTALLLLGAGFVFATAIVGLILYVVAEVADLWGKPLIERTPVPSCERSLDDALSACDWRWPA